MVLFNIVVMVATLAMVQGCSESESPVESVITEVVENETFIGPNGEVIDIQDLRKEMSVWFENNPNFKPADHFDSSGLSVNKTSGMPWWWYINLNIWGRTVRDWDTYVGIECKPYVRKVVRDVTGQSIPSTWKSPNDYKWYDGGHAIKIVDGNVVGGGTIERGIGFGNLIQMRLSNGRPHTAIFYEYVPGGMNWIDANFVGHLKVGVHFVSWGWFRDNVDTRYSIYQAINW